MRCVGHARVCRGVGLVDLASDAAARQPQRARRDQQRAAATGERVAEGFDRRAVDARGVVHAREIVQVSEVDDAVDLARRGVQRGQVLERAADDFGAERRDLGRCRVGAHEPDDLVAGGDQFDGAGRADPARSTGDENAHDPVPSRDVTK
ncbi:hypothetical protein GALL_485440 [mine drainage metagenome]|uniref:Uncharacterized protein n=1 Tax=mine drainage metagenome TaxID=410659 RepID=A0A1J5PQK2_9ZZZZ